MEHRSFTRILGWLSAFLLSFSLFGFPIQSFISFILNVNSNPINVAFRFLLLLVAIAVLLGSFLLVNIRKGFDWGWTLFLGFWFFYGTRLIYDIEIQKLTYLDKDSFFVYSFAFGVVLLPSIAVYVGASLIDIRLLKKMCVSFLILSNILLLYAMLTANSWSLADMLLKRGEVTVELQGEVQSIVNPITVSAFGTTISLICIHGLLFFQWSRSARTVIYGILLLGIANLTLGGSRGPLVVFITLSVYLLIRYIVRVQRFRYLIIPLVLMSALLLLFGERLVEYLLFDSDLVISARFSEFFSSSKVMQKEIREYEWESAIRQFMMHPLLGDAFVTEYDKAYSHNIFLDVIMSTGVVGALIFGGILYHLFKSFRELFEDKDRFERVFPVIMFWLITFISSFFSGGLFVLSGFWMLTAFFLSKKSAV